MVRWPCIPRARIGKMIGTLLLFYVLFAVFLFTVQRSMIYFPDTTRPDPASSGVPGMKFISVQPDDMNHPIEGWYQPPSDLSKPIILYFHGNALNQGARGPLAKVYLDAGYGVLLAGYRGYAGNPGQPGEAGFYADADAYYKWLTDVAGVAEKNIVLYGESLGTGVATYLAAKHPDIRALVLESPYTSLVEIARLRFFFLPLGLMMKDKFPSIERIRDVRAPLLIIHARKDMVIPLRFAEKLYALANQPKQIIISPDGGHNDLYAYGAGAKILRFLEKGV